MTDQTVTPPVVQNWTEAPGIAWTDLWAKSGAKISITARANNPIEALDSLAQAIKYAAEKYSLTTTKPEPDWNRPTRGMPEGAPAHAQPIGASQPELKEVVQPAPAPATTVSPAPVQPISPAQPEPQYAPVEPVLAEAIEVVKIKHTVNDNGKHMLRVFGGKYQKFGLICWPEKLPQGFNLEALQVGFEYQPTPAMRLANVKDGKTVTSFTA